MFKGNSNTSPVKPVENNSPERLNRIVDGTVIQGDIKCESNIRIDGKVIGNVTSSGRLVIGSQGIIEGDIYCQNADIEGTFNGKITVQEQLSLKSTAKLTGDIIANKLSIEPGANFSGSCAMGGSKTTSAGIRKPETEKLAQSVVA
jgi:cytoskeletal protein CcmA (bactofilin family)